MNTMKRFLLHLKFHLLEEYRLQTGFIGKVQFVLFPLFITFLVFVISLASPVIMEDMSRVRGLSILHMVILFYGLMLGGFALFGEAIAEKRWGKVNLLLAAPFTQPLSFNYNFLVFYVKDIIFYIFFSLIPIGLGISLSLPFSDHTPGDVGLLTFCLFLTFLVGISLSFLLSSVYVRQKGIFAGLMALMGLTIIISISTDLYETRELLPSLAYNLNRHPGFFLVTMGLVILFSMLAVLLVKVERSKQKGSNKPELIKNNQMFSWAKDYSPYLAKEWIDLKRTRMLGTFFGVYVGPLLLIALILWFFSKFLDLKIPINSIFYSAMIGFLGVTAYSFLNLLDSQCFYQTLPVSVPRLIKTKLIMFMMLTLLTSSLYIVGISIFLKDLKILWLALIVSVSTTLYSVVVTAYLTGLKTNTYLFSPKVLGKFWVLVVTPLAFVTISSFLMDDSFLVPVIMILFASGLMLLLSVFFYRRIDRNWAEESFLE